MYGNIVMTSSERVLLLVTKNGGKLSNLMTSFKIVLSFMRYDNFELFNAQDIFRQQHLQREMKVVKSDEELMRFDNFELFNTQYIFKQQHLQREMKVVKSDEELHEI